MEIAAFQNGFPEGLFYSKGVLIVELHMQICVLLITNEANSKITEKLALKYKFSWFSVKCWMIR